MVSRTAVLSDVLDQMDAGPRRALLDALNEARPSYWRKRAQTFRKVGTPGADETARACENRARVAELFPAGSFLEWLAEQ